MTKEKQPKISVIMPIQDIDAYVHESISHVLQQEYSEFELILLPNTRVSNKWGKRVRIFPTGNIQPAEKRNIGAQKAMGDILAFIDDDAYPADRRWFARAATYFSSSSQLGALGGPNLTPQEDGTFQIVCGEVLASHLFSGPASRRYRRAKAGPYHDLPSCNLFVAKKIFEEVGGFYPHFWPGEDTKLCADIIRQGKQVFYDPNILVFHHRRKGWEGYVRQTFRFGLHRGYFMKLFPYTSLRPIFFLPLLFVLGLLFGPWLAFIHPFFLYAYAAVFLLYVVLISGAATASHRWATIPLFILIGFTTHIAYGIGVAVGLVTSAKQSRLKPKHER